MLDRESFVSEMITMYIYLIANKYMMDPLTSLAQKKLLENLSDNWNDLNFVCLLEDVYGDEFPPQSQFRQSLPTNSIEHLQTLERHSEFVGFLDLWKYSFGARFKELDRYASESIMF